MVVNVDRYGNTSSGSIPLALADAEADGRLEPGALVLMTGMGAGPDVGLGVDGVDGEREDDMTIAFCFPGQGSLEEGMGREIARGRPGGDGGLSRRERCLRPRPEAAVLRGAARELVQTEVQQPALVATSLAVLAALRARGIAPDYVVGHSVGEFAAIAAANSIDTGEAIGLVRERGLAMAEAARESDGTMAAILGLDDEVVEELCAEIEGVWPANYNCPGQIVVSGEEEAVEELIARPPQLGASATVKLKVSGAFHSPLVAKAAEMLQAGGRACALQRAGRAVHVDGDREDRAGAAHGRPARRPGDRAGEVHAGGARARRRRA